jgi:hypothetical protein
MGTGAKIADVVQINGGYASYVDLHEEYYDSDTNRVRMARYKPITAHRLAFEKIAKALGPKDRRFYFLSGSYGTGKSHLLLMLANYFASSSDLPEIEAFFQNYARAQSEVLLKPGEVLKEGSADSLKEARKSGRYLVAICRHELNLDFQGTLLRALEEALEKDGAEISPDSYYSEAVRRLSDWKTRRDEARFYGDLEAALVQLYPDWTVDRLVDGLEKRDKGALDAFKACFRQVTDTEFAYSKDNLRGILSDLLKDESFRNRYKGIVFLYDEFGAAIDDNRVNYNALLDFAEYCATSTLEKNGPVIFIGSGHKAFRNHGHVGDLNAETLEARVTEVGLETQGMEDVISAIVQPRKESPEWKGTIEPISSKFTWLSGECTRLKLFERLPAPKIRADIIENVYPMHPLATYALLRLASEVGSDTRSVFKFFSPEFDTGEQGRSNAQPYSYPWFVENHRIVEQGKFVLYPVDLLADYFSESLRSTNERLTDRVKKAMVDYEVTTNALNAYLARQSEGRLFDQADELMRRILKVLLVNEVISTQTVPIPNTAQNVEFALDFVSPEEQAQVKARLKSLCEAGILFDNDGVFELVRSDRRDVRRLVDQFKADPSQRVGSTLESFQQAAPLQKDEAYLEAKDYNARYNEDKRLKVVFAKPSELSSQTTVDGQAVSYFAALERERLEVQNPTNGYEGIVIYAFCEDDQDIDQAKRAAALNDQARVVVAVPRYPVALRDALSTLAALDSSWFQEQAAEFGPYERAEEKKIRDEAQKSLEAAKRRYFTNSNVYWFGTHGRDIPIDEEEPHHVATLLMGVLYENVRNSFAHTDFNKIHVNLAGQVRKILEEAGDLLCDLTRPVPVNWSWPDNRGGTKYLRKCFLDQHALQVIRVEGDVRCLEAERSIDTFRHALPAYAQLLENLGQLEDKEETNLAQFIKPLFEQYGQGEIAVTLMLLLARRFYGDSLRFKRSGAPLTDMEFRNTEDMLSLVQGKEPGAVILVEAVSKEDQDYFAEILRIFAGQPLPAGHVATIQQAYQAVLAWWDGFPSIARSLDFYPNEWKGLGETFSRAKTQDAFTFVVHDLASQLGREPEEVLTPSQVSEMAKKLSHFKEIVEDMQATVEKRILEGVAEVFGAHSSLDLDVQDALKNWFDRLSSSQKDPMGLYHNNDSKPLVRYTNYSAIRDLLFKDLPSAYSFRPVSSWSSDNVEAYIGRMRKGKDHIETKAPQVGRLKLDFENDSSRNDSTVTYHGELILHAGTEDGRGTIFYTLDGSDPVASPQCQKLAPGEKLAILGNRQIKLLVADDSGNYSAVQTIQAIDELQKYRIARPAQTNALEEAVTFIFPNSREAVHITVSSLISELAGSGLLSMNELRQLVLDALSQLEE